MSFTIDTVTIRNPNFGDVRRVDQNSEIRDLRGGALDMIRDIDWINDLVYRYSFSVLKDITGNTEINDLKTLLASKAADLVSITDHLGDTRSGIIITPVNEIINSRDECSHEISFEFLEDAIA